MVSCRLEKAGKEKVMLKSISCFQIQERIKVIFVGFEILAIAFTAIILIAVLAYFLLRKEREELRKPSAFEALQARISRTRQEKEEEVGVKRKLKKSKAKKGRETKLSKVGKYRKALDVWE